YSPEYEPAYDSENRVDCDSAITWSSASNARTSRLTCPTGGPATNDIAASTVTTSPGTTLINRDEKNPPHRSPVPHFTKPSSDDNHGASAAVSLKSGSGHLSTGRPGSAVINGFTGGAILSVTTRSGPRQNGLRNFAVTPTV